jgi:uncharacterized protein (DUF1330 family)
LLLGSSEGFLNEGEKVMKTKYTVALAMVASFALGAVAVQSLHAQAKPVAYLVAEVVVSNQEAYEKEFVPPAMKAAKDQGGKYLALGGKTVSFAGAPPAPRVVVIQFESMDKVQTWWNSAARRDASAIGDKYGTFRTYAVEGVSP